MKTDTLAEALNELMGAYGILADEPKLGTFVYEAIVVIETEFCARDWRAYREWARRFATDYQVEVEPCDEWFSRDEKWIDEGG